MSANVGLSTPRGSGTSGYVQRNNAHLRPRDRFQPYPKEPELLKHKQRQPDRQILAHERARNVEVKVFDLRDRLEEEGVDEDEIETQCTALRQKLTAEAEAGRSGRPGPGKEAVGRNLKRHQVHEMAAAKIQESERLRRALGIRKDYEEGGHWKKQEERLRESLQKRDNDDAELDTRHERRGSPPHRRVDNGRDYEESKRAYSSERDSEHERRPYPRDHSQDRGRRHRGERGYNRDEDDRGRENRRDDYRGQPDDDGSEQEWDHPQERRRKYSAEYDDFKGRDDDRYESRVRRRPRSRSETPRSRSRSISSRSYSSRSSSRSRSRSGNRASTNARNKARSITRSRTRSISRSSSRSREGPRSRARPRSRSRSPYRPSRSPPRR